MKSSLITSAAYRAAEVGIQPHMDSTLKAMFAHMAWADARLAAHLDACEAASGALRLFTHVVAAERVWLLRLRGEDSAGQAIWPEWTLEEARAVASENAVSYAGLVARLSPADAARVVEYRNSQGVPFSTEVRSILLQVALHGSYHRGQIAAALRAGGAAPVNTDYITFVREGGMRT